MKTTRNAGFGLLEAVIAVAIIGISFMAMLSLVEPIQKQQNLISTKTSLTQTMISLVSILSNPNAWVNTIHYAFNPSMSCLVAHTCVPSSTGSFDLIDAGNNLDFSGGIMALGVYGFSPAGVPCNTYSASGNSACPFKLTLQWAILCTGACPPPYQVRVLGSFAYNPAGTGSAYALNAANYNINLIVNSP